MPPTGLAWRPRCPPETEMKRGPGPPVRRRLRRRTTTPCSHTQPSRGNSRTCTARTDPALLGEPISWADYTPVATPGTPRLLALLYGDVESGCVLVVFRNGRACEASWVEPDPFLV